MSPFTLLRRTPSIFLAELTWRWSFGLGAIAVLLFVVRRVAESLKLAGLFDLSFAHADPMERLQMTAEALVRVIPMIAPVALWAAVAMTVMWLVSATIGRGAVTAAIVRQIASQPETQVVKNVSWSSMAGAHFARVFTLIIPLIGYLLAATAENAILRRSLPPESTAPNLAELPPPSALLAMVLVFLTILGASLVLWSVAHFVASLAPIFAARDGRKTLDALAESVALSRRRWREFAAEAAQNATLRTVVAFAITVAAILVGVLFSHPAPILAWTLVAALTFAYIVISDWLLLARTVAYAQIAEADRATTPIRSEAQ